MSAGSAHVMVTTKNNEVFAWGCGDNGRLGLGDDYDSQCLPQPVHYAKHNIASTKIASAHCGDDCTVFLTTKGAFLACGSNRHNKLAIAPIKWLGGDGDAASAAPGRGSDYAQSGEVNVPTPPAASDVSGSIVAVAIGSAHMAMLTAAGRVHTFGSNSYVCESRWPACLAKQV